MKSMFKSALGALMVMLALCGLTAASALAAGAPVVETKTANSLSETTAYLNGVVNPNGAETKDYFEYGPTVSYGSKSHEQTTNVEKKPDILVEGLTRGTTYHFRMVAKNSFGTSYGADEVFTTTKEKPEAVVTGSRGFKISELKIVGSGGATTLAWGGGKALTCTSSSFSGHFINPKELEGTMRWTECFGGDRYECDNEHEIKGGYIHSWVQSEPLKGTLGYINKAKKEVGVKLKGASSEVWANKVDCLGSTWPLTGALGGQLDLPVNTKIPATGGFSIAYTEKADEQITGELGGQLIWQENGATDFGIGGSLSMKANEEFEIQA